jgi:ABC-type glycerol-3-phosphate transport system substrate-binding protein
MPRPPAHLLTLLAVLGAATLLLGACSGEDEDPDVSAYCPAEEALLNAQIELKTTNEDEALAEKLDEVEELTRTFQEEAPDLIEEQATVVAEETYTVLDEIRSDELTPADASDRLISQFDGDDVATANAIISAFDAEFCPDFEGTIPDIPDPALPIPPASGEVPTTVPPTGEEGTTTSAP